MKLTLKAISPKAVPDALQKVERYRLLNQPSAAQSICEDILQVDPENQEALILLVLTMADQIGDGVSEAEARRVASRLRGEYQTVYYTGIICERSAKAILAAGYPGCTAAASGLLQEAMDCFERAEAIRPEDNDDAILEVEYVCPDDSPESGAGTTTSR